MENTDLIARQKLVADDVLRKLELTDPYCIVAGGAPRDWLNGVPAKDLDVYFHVPVNVTVSAAKDILNAHGFNITQSSDEKPDRFKLYEHMKHLRGVYDCEVSGMKVQFILMGKPCFSSVVEYFSCSLCEAWYKNRAIRYTDEFILARITKSIVINEKMGYTRDNYHIQKIMKKFPSYVVRSRESALEQMLLRYK